MSNGTRAVAFTVIELISILRLARAGRDRLKEDLEKIEERIKAGHDGVLQSSAIILAAEISIVEEGIKKMQVAYAYPDGGPPTLPSAV